MITLFIALTVGQIQVLQNGASKGSAAVVNCGANVTCAVVGGRWTLSATGGGGIVIPVCSAGQVVTANGTLLSCTNVIATATALAANPADCSANQYATTIAANGDLTCAQVACSQLSGTLTDSQLASAYSGVGACSAHQWVSTETRNATPTCTQPAYTDLSGCEPAQGTSPQVQYNNSACVGGMVDTEASTTGDLAVLSLQAQSSGTPVAPRSIHYDSRPDSGWFAQAEMMDYAMNGVPIPVGSLTASGYGIPGAGSRDIWRCVSLAVATQISSGCTWFSSRGNDWVPNNSSASAAGAASDAGWFNHQPWCHLTSNTAGNSNAESHDTQAALFYSGGNATGGFWWHTRACAGKTMPSNTGRVFFGLINSNSAISGTTEITNLTNMVGFACDPADSNFKVCSNDTSGTATCTASLGSNFPCKTSGACYDFGLFSPPGDARIFYQILRLPDTDNTARGQTASGPLTSDFPDPNTTMAGHMHHNTGDSGVADELWDGLEIECAHL